MIRPWQRNLLLVVDTNKKNIKPTHTHQSKSMGTNPDRNHIYPTFNGLVQGIFVAGKPPYLMVKAMVSG